MFYVNQNFPIADKLWTGIDSPFEITFFKEKYFVNPLKKIVKPVNHSYNIPSFFIPILLNYQKEKDKLPHTYSKDLLVSVDFRKDWSLFFRAVHSLKEELILNKIKKINTFNRVMEQFNGKKLNMAESSYILEPMPGIHIAYLFWEEDEEFPASLKILFHKKLADIFMQDMVWGIIVETNYRIANHEKYISTFQDF